MATDKPQHSLLMYSNKPRPTFRLARQPELMWRRNLIQHLSSAHAEMESIDVPNCGIIRRTLKAVVNFFFLFMEGSSIHGFKHLTRKKRHPIEQLVWMFALCTAISCSLWLSLSTWRRFQDNPTVVSMERNYKDWNTSFPAITLCPILKSGEANIQHLLQNQ